MRTISDTYLNDSIESINEPIYTLALLYENGRPITLVAPIIIITIYYFIFVTVFSAEIIINYILVLLGVICLRMGINNVNNAYDVEADKINKPHRPIPRGDLPIQSAFIIGLILQVISLFVFMLLSPFAFLLDLSFVVLGWLYNIERGLKNIFPLNNFVIGYVRGFGFLLAPLSLNVPIKPIFYIYALSIMFYIFGSVNSKDIKDVSGDLKTNRVTLPIMLGDKSKYLGIISAPFILAPVLILSILSIQGYVRPIFLFILVLIPFDLLIVYYMTKASTTAITENTTAWLMMIITYLAHHLVFAGILMATTRVI